MQTTTNNTKSSSLGLADFVETDVAKQAEMEAMLRDSKLEDVMSPIYFIFNVNAAIIGF